MKPLSSPVIEYGTLGVADVGGGLVLAGAGVVLHGPGALAGTVLIGAFFGGSMYALAYRRFVRQAIEAARPVPIPERELRSATRLRILRASAGTLLFMAVVAALADAPDLIAGITIGNGFAVGQMSRQCAAWEAREGASLLREPRWRGIRGGDRGWGRGRGSLDSRDFYFEAA